MFNSFGHGYSERTNRGRLGKDPRWDRRRKNGRVVRTASGRAASPFQGDPMAFLVAQYAVRDLGRTEETLADYVV